MNIVILAVIALVLLVGLVAIGIGNRGWNWGNVAAAILLLLAVSGYFFLAARVATHEGSWRKKVAATEKEIARVRGGSGAAGDSLEALKQQRDRWKRVRTFVETWHGRSWKGTEFFPPRGGKPGRITLEMPSADSGVPPVNKGADIAVFDNANFADGGRFLGIFRVTDVAANKGDAGWPVTVLAAEDPLPPSTAEAQLWSRDYEDVTAYATLPVDHWRAFHSLAEEALAADGGPPAAESATGMPRGKKASVDELLTDLEDLIQKVKDHDEEVPEDKWQERAAQLTDGTIPEGSLWAVVEFEEDVMIKKKGDAIVMEPAAATSEAEAAPADDDDEGPVGAPGEMAAPGEMINNGDADPFWKKFFSEPKTFSKGSLAEFDYKTAVELQDEKHWCRIKSVIYRRPLTDPFTALRGSAVSEGASLLKSKVLDEIARFERNSAQVDATRRSVDTQAETVADETRQIGADLTSWEQDVAAADKTAAAFDKRLKEATLELAALEATIVDLGKELRGAVATLTQTIDASAPPPVRQR
jgi:hypothetical protein